MLRSYYNKPVSLLQRFKAISESVGASDGGTAKEKFFAEIDGPLDDRYVGLLTDGYNGAYGLFRVGCGWRHLGLLR